MCAWCKLDVYKRITYNCTDRSNGEFLLSWYYIRFTVRNGRKISSVENSATVFNTNRIRAISCERLRQECGYIKHYRINIRYSEGTRRNPDTTDICARLL